HFSLRQMDPAPHQIGMLVRNFQFASRSSLRCNKCSRFCDCIFLRFDEMSPRIAMIPTRAAISMKIGTENHHYSRTVSNNRQAPVRVERRGTNKNTCCEVDAAFLK